MTISCPHPKYRSGGIILCSVSRERGVSMLNRSYQKRIGERDDSLHSPDAPASASRLLEEDSVPNFIRPLKLRFLSMTTLSYLIVDKSSRQAAIVDPAWESERLVSEIEALDVTLTAILLTHSHFDHIQAVKPLMHWYGARVYMSAEEIDFYKFRSARLQALCDRDIVQLADTNISCLLTPGHTAGGMCFHSPGSLFTGDTVFIEGCGICNKYGGSAEQMFESIQRIKTAFDPDVRIYPGHSFGKEPGQPLRLLMKENIYFQIDERDAFINWRMRDGV